MYIYIYSNVFFSFFFRLMQFLSLLFCTLMLQDWDRSMLINTNELIRESTKKKKEKKNVRIICTYIRWRREDPFFILSVFRFFGRCVSLFLRKSDPLKRYCVISITQSQCTRSIFSSFIKDYISPSVFVSSDFFPI